MNRVRKWRVSIIYSGFLFLHFSLAPNEPGDISPQDVSSFFKCLCMVGGDLEGHQHTVLCEHPNLKDKDNPRAQDIEYILDSYYYITGSDDCGWGDPIVDLFAGMAKAISKVKRKPDIREEIIRWYGKIWITAPQPYKLFGPRPNNFIGTKEEFITKKREFPFRLLCDDCLFIKKIFDTVIEATINVPMEPDADGTINFEQLLESELYMLYSSLDVLSVSKQGAQGSLLNVIKALQFDIIIRFHYKWYGHPGVSKSDVNSIWEKQYIRDLFLLKEHREEFIDLVMNRPIDCHNYYACSQEVRTIRRHLKSACACEKVELTLPDDCVKALCLLTSLEEAQIYSDEVQNMIAQNERCTSSFWPIIMNGIMDHTMLLNGQKVLVDNDILQDEELLAGIGFIMWWFNQPAFDRPLEIWGPVAAQSKPITLAEETQDREASGSTSKPNRGVMQQVNQVTKLSLNNTQEQFITELYHKILPPKVKFCNPDPVDKMIEQILLQLDMQEVQKTVIKWYGQMLLLTKLPFDQSPEQRPDIFLNICHQYELLKSISFIMSKYYRGRSVTTRMFLNDLEALNIHGSQNPALYALTKALQLQIILKMYFTHDQHDILQQDIQEVREILSEPKSGEYLADLVINRFLRPGSHIHFYPQITMWQSTQVLLDETSQEPIQQQVYFNIPKVFIKTFKFLTSLTSSGLYPLGKVINSLENCSSVKQSFWTNLMRALKTSRGWFIKEQNGYGTLFMGNDVFASLPLAELDLQKQLDRMSVKFKVLEESNYEDFMRAKALKKSPDQFEGIKPEFKGSSLKDTKGSSLKDTDAIDISTFVVYT